MSSTFLKKLFFHKQALSKIFYLNWSSISFFYQDNIKIV
jgi:hypothetical protein